jgi:hypothetical protein
MKLNRYLLWCALLCFNFTLLRGQNNVGIGIATPDPSAVLHLNDTRRGLLIPRMDSTQRQAIAAPANGLMVFDNSVNCFYYFTTTGGWTSMCPGGIANPYNISLNYNPQTDTLSITDGGGTLSTNLSPLRADVKLSQDISTSSVIGAVNTFNAMPGMSLTFTPNKSVVYIMATASGNGDPTQQVEQGMSIRIRDVTGAPMTVVGGNTLSNAQFYVSSAQQSYGTGWNISLSTVYNVTPGVPVTLQMEWSPSNPNGAVVTQATCDAATQPDFAHCNLLVFE